MYGMKRSRHGVARRQAGATTLGFIIIAAFAGLFVFAAIRLTPVYLNYMKIVGVVDGVRQEFDGQKPTSAVIRRSISRRFDVRRIAANTNKPANATIIMNPSVVAPACRRATPCRDRFIPYITNVLRPFIGSITSDQSQ